MRDTKQRKIVIMSWHNYDLRIQELFAIPFLLQNDACVEYWDVSAISIPGYHVSGDRIPEGLVNKEIRNKAHFVNEIEKNSKNDVVYIVFMTLCKQSLLCYHILSKYKCIIAHCVNGCLPTLPLDTNKSIGKKIFRVLTSTILLKYIKAKCNNYLFNAIVNSGYISPVDYLFITCGVASPLNNCKVGSNTKWIHFNSGDYQRAMSRRNDKRILEGSYIVFIDQNIPFHPDNNLIKVQYDADAYFSDMNNLFEKVEKKTGLKVIIAAHPSCSDKYINNDYFNGRKVFTRVTDNLVQYSSGVISHDSTAVAFPVVFKKPILFVLTEGMVKSHGASFSFCKAMSTLLNRPFIGYDGNFTVPDDWGVDDTSYDAYKYSYLTNPDTENISNGEILLKSFYSE